jgi:uncharacterized protein
MIASANPLSISDESIKEAYCSYISGKHFACIGAKAALAKEHMQCFVASNMACGRADQAILHFLYNFIEGYRNSADMYHSAAVIFRSPARTCAEDFDNCMWQRLQSLSDLDAVNYPYDPRVDQDPASPNFSFSLKAEALFIIGMHPSSSRALRSFTYPTLVFNPHFQFEQLRRSGKYEKMKDIVRKRDIAFSGSVNPMLRNFGDASEVFQYSGREYDDSWQCPLKVRHAANNGDTPT